MDGAMLSSETQLFELTDRFHAAAVGADTWVSALAALAEATGSRSGQIIGLGPDASVPFNWITNFDPDAVAEFAAIGGGDPATNPRIRAGFFADEMVVLADADYITPDIRRESEIFADFYTRWDIPFICHANIVKRRDMVIGLSVNRTKREGDIDDEARRVLTLVAPHARAAVFTQMALEGQGAALIAGAMDALSIAVFVCDQRGRVLARSPQTEALLSRGGQLRLTAGRLTAAHRGHALALENAIAVAANAGEPRLHGVALSALDGGAPLVLDVTTLPRRAHGFSLDACVLIVARTGRRDATTLAAMLRAAYAITATEAEVAAGLLDGLSPDEIAATRSASVHPVRTQIKSLYAKMAVSSRAELAARLQGLR